MRSGLKYLLIVSTAAFASVQVASAADQAIPKALPLVATWAGPYAGLNLGWVWHRARAVEDSTIPLFTIDEASLKQTGLTAGGQLGYNWQVQNYVYGVEADFNWVGGRGSHFTAPTIEVTTEMNWLATFRVRAGFVVNPLFYVTGGLAVANIENKWDNLGSPFTEFGSDRTRVGYAVGAGIEHMFAQNRTLRLEVLYVDFGKDRVNATFTVVPYTSEFRNAAVIARGAFNLKW
jgi:outer membrane immunogenic protein